MRKQSNSLMGIFLLWAVVAVLLMGMVVFIFAATVEAHEEDGWHHLGDRLLGPNVIYAIECHDKTWILFVDYDADMKHDGCYQIKDEHGEIHYKVLDKCQCPKGDEDL